MNKEEAKKLGQRVGNIISWILINLIQGFLIIFFVSLALVSIGFMIKLMLWAFLTGYHSIGLPAIK